MQRLLLIWLVLILGLGNGVNAMPQEPPATQDDLQRQIDLLKKQKELLELQKQVSDAQRALVNAQNAPADALASAKAAKDLADAQKAIADSKKAVADSELAAFKSALGEIPSSGISGTVEVKDKAGELEASLLAIKAVREAAAIVGRATRTKLETNTSIVLVTAGGLPTFDNMMAYDAEREIVRAVLERTIAAATPTAQGLTTEAAVPVLGAAGILLDSANKLLSFFKSDVTVQGVALSLDDSIALNEVAKNLSTAIDDKEFDVSVPEIYSPVALQNAAKFFIADVQALSKLRLDASVALSKTDALIGDLKSKIATETNAAVKKAFEDQLAIQTKLSDGLKSAMGLMDGWYSKLGTPDGKGVTTLVHVTREKTIAAALENGSLMVVKVQKAGGGVLTKKNLWTIVGGMPLYHMGGAAVSFTLVNGKTGLVQASSVIPIHGGFVKAGDVKGLLER